jgi:hypothetical protein
MVWKCPYFSGIQSLALKESDFNSEDAALIAEHNE